MDEIYNKLNDYLNEICKYLEVQDSFLLENIHILAGLNDKMLMVLNNYNFDNKVITNKLTFEDVFNLAREIIEQIDVSYLDSFDSLIKTGELDFSYENKYYGSHYQYFYNDNKEVLGKLININREFSYDDVLTLVHEFIHYTNGDRITNNRYYLTEFLSIYFEFFAIDYLLEKGIDKEEMDYLFRFKFTKKSCKLLNRYELILLAYSKFGKIDDNSYVFLKQFFLDISKETFENECKDFCELLIKAEKNTEEEIKKNPKCFGEIISKEFITSNYRYIMGTALAIYARKYVDFKDMVYLNNHINDFNDKDVFDICKSMGINKYSDFINMLYTAMDEYLNELDVNIKKQNR